MLGIVFMGRIIQKKKLFLYIICICIVFWSFVVVSIMNYLAICYVFLIAPSERGLMLSYWNLACFLKATKYGWKMKCQLKSKILVIANWMIIFFGFKWNLQKIVCCSSAVPRYIYTFYGTWFVIIKNTTFCDLI